VTIWKFELQPGKNRLQMPIGAKLLSVHPQRDSISLWALVRPENKRTERRIFVALTGSDAPGVAPDKFIGTVLLDEGAFVVHVFDCGDGPVEHW